MGGGKSEAAERRNTSGRDAKGLAIWLESGGCGGASGGHVATRVAVMCLVHALAKAEPPIGWRNTAPGSHATEQELSSATLADEALELARELYRMHALVGVEELLRVALAAVSGQDADLCKESYRRGSAVHRRKIRAWQLLCAASPALVPLCDPSPSAAVPGGARGVLGELLVAAAPAAVAVHNLPGVRCYAELFYTLATLAHPNLLDAVILPALRDADLKPGPGSSLVVVAAGYVLRAPRSAVGKVCV
jgi:tRNA guanosine-2'-O-methyltransferase